MNTGISTATLAEGLKSLEHKRYKIKIEPLWEKKKKFVFRLLSRYRMCRGTTRGLISYFTYSKNSRAQQLRAAAYKDRNMSEVLCVDVENTIGWMLKKAPAQADALIGHGYLKLTFDDLAKIRGCSKQAVKEAWKAAAGHCYQELYEDYKKIIFRGVTLLAKDMLL